MASSLAGDGGGVHHRSDGPPAVRQSYLDGCGAVWTADAAHGCGGVLAGNCDGIGGTDGLTEMSEAKRVDGMDGTMMAVRTRKAAVADGGNAAKLPAIGGDCGCRSRCGHRPSSG